MGCWPSAEEVALLSNRPLDHPQQLDSNTEIWLTQSYQPQMRAVMDPQGRVTQNPQLDVNQTCVGWVDATGTSYANDYNRTVRGKVDLSSGEVFDFKYGTTNKLGRVDLGSGEVVVYAPVGHQTKVGFVKGPGKATAGCALLTLW
eukprot:TRINITY_DN6310_c0_g1_i1.p1 TRINITY_DN6310_c0_g1~~TRINITY_DN6310_c0_g1_i1.p1  ORF type:complete len:145 (-),score=21.54 TRINITY_DN6310_c0_g1_i1:2-436(-)